METGTRNKNKKTINKTNNNNKTHYTIYYTYYTNKLILSSFSS